MTRQAHFKEGQKVKYEETEGEITGIHGDVARVQYGNTQHASFLAPIEDLEAIQRE